MERIITVASQYVGKKEKPGNSGFIDKEFEKEMLSAGWRPGYAWCALVLKLIVSKTYSNINMSLFVPSAVNTFNNLKKAGFVVLQTPVHGALVFWQRYKNGVATWQGHCGLVSNVDGNKFKSYEGNTNSNGSRDGDTFCEKNRVIDYTVTNGLRLLGFIKLK